MSLLVAYVILVALGQAAGVATGLTVDKVVNEAIGLIAFLISFFAVFVIAWLPPYAAAQGESRVLIMFRCGR
jgi:hypothetical protein